MFVTSCQCQMARRGLEAMVSCSKECLFALGSERAVLEAAGITQHSQLHTKTLLLDLHLLLVLPDKESERSARN